MRLVLASILLPASVRGAYPNEIVWAGCGAGANCATLEFCKSGSSTYGYRAVGDVAPCGSAPGPLIRMVPGETYRLTLRNAIDDPSEVTNVHTHGLHQVGDGDGDNVVRSVEGGSCLDYTWDILADHPGGTHWYHAHHHPDTLDQITGGAFGMVIVEDADLGSLTSWAYHRENERLLMIAGTSNSVTANGSDNEVIELEADKWFRLRVAVVTPTAKVADLSFNGGGCEVLKVASDGVWHAGPFANYADASDTFPMTGAGRADFAIKCPAGTTAVKWGQQDAASIVAGDFGTGSGMAGVVDDLGGAPARPPSLSGMSPVDLPVAPNAYDVALNAATINSVDWDPNAGLGSIPFGEVHEWTISGSGAHPFHLHLYHMLIVEPGGCGSAFEEGEFYDTISASGDCKVRFKTADIGQRMVMHCHVLDHEDKGAMTFMDVVGDIPPSNLNLNYVPSYACPSSGVTTTEAPPACSTAACQADADCCTGVCKSNGRCDNNAVTGDSPPSLSPTPAPSAGPSASPVTAPPGESPVTAPPSASPAAFCSTTTCQEDGDCCTNVCKNNGRCDRARYLRA